MFVYIYIYIYMLFIKTKTHRHTDTDTHTHTHINTHTDKMTQKAFYRLDLYWCPKDDFQREKKDSMPTTILGPEVL